MLEDDERKALIVRVADYTNSDPEILKPVITSQHVMRIMTHKIPVMYADNVVNYCERSAWIEDPALIIRLLGRIVVRYADTQPIIDRLKDNDPPRYFIGDPWDTCLLALQLPFLNRVITRTTVKLFTTDLDDPLEPGARVLIVNGPPHSGKSFTYDYIRYINQFLGPTYKIAWVDYKKEVNSRFGPADLIKSLLNQIEPSWDETELPVLDAQQPARWIQELAKFLARKIAGVEQIKHTAIKWFLILDGFDDVNVPRETIELIQQLGAIAVGSLPTEQAENTDLIRLVLLGFREAVPDFKRRVRVDSIDPKGPIQRNDVELYFKRYASYKKWKHFSAADLQITVDKVIQLAPPATDPNYAKLIAQIALRTARRIERDYLENIP